MTDPARGRSRATSRRGAPAAADLAPVARVLVDMPLAHLDRPFDYLVPAADDASCVPGCRVRVRFSGRLVDGFVVDRSPASDHPGQLAFLARVVSPEPVLAPEIAVLARTVADRCAGTMADVLRLAIPPRHAGAEAAAAPVVPTPPEPVRRPVVPAVGPGDPSAETGAGSSTLDRYAGGEALLAALRDNRRPRAVWAVLPGPSPVVEVAAAVEAARTGGCGVLVIVPDARDVERFASRLDGAVALQATAGPARRYSQFLAVCRGAARVVVGTRSAVYAPVRDLGLIVVWDDGDDLLAEPRAPYPHARDVALLRAHQQGTALLLAGHAVTAEGAQLVVSGWARPLRAVREIVRAVAPRVLVAGEDVERGRDAGAAVARLPSLAWRTAKDALQTGPVLLQVPRRGYLPGLACARCRTPARCSACAGPLVLTSASGTPACRWCGRPDAAFACPACGDSRLRAATYGEQRTAEEIGRALPGVPVRTSGRDGVLSRVPNTPALVVSTPGAEPVADGDGYAAVLLLDGWSLLGRPDLRAGEEALRRWLNAAALAAPRAPVVVMADASPPAVQALVRWDPAGHASRELAERAELGFPPAVRMATIDAEPAVLQAYLGGLSLPVSAEILGPVSTADEGRERVLVRVPRADGAALAAALHAAAATRSARKEGGGVRVALDPVVLG